MANVMTDTTRLAGALADTMDALRRVIRGAVAAGVDVEDAQDKLDKASKALLDERGWQTLNGDLAIGDYVVPAGVTEPIMRIKGFGQKGGAGPIFAECERHGVPGTFPRTCAGRAIFPSSTGSAVTGF